MSSYAGFSDKSADAIDAASGQTIESIRFEHYVHTDDGIAHPLDRLVINLESGTLALWDAGGQCCEERYIHTDDYLDDYVGARFISARRLEHSESWDEDGGEHAIDFIHVKTSAGTFVLQTHNEHNGYYGGFDLCAQYISRDEEEATREAAKKRDGRRKAKVCELPTGAMFRSGDVIDDRLFMVLSYQGASIAVLERVGTRDGMPIWAAGGELDGDEVVYEDKNLPWPNVEYYCAACGGRR